MVTLIISLKGKPKQTLSFPGDESKTTIKDVKAAVQAKFPHLVANRQRLTLSAPASASTAKPGRPAKPLALVDEDKTLKEYGVGDNAELRLKDLGRQVGYRQLYLWEYAGPIFLNPLFLKYSHLLWGSYTPSSLQITIRNIIVLHFIKRWLESAFVHRFSRATVPLSFVARNCLYYWGVVGLLIGLTLYRPAYSASALQGTLLDNSLWIGFWSIFALDPLTPQVSELLNLQSHMHLASLAVPPGQPRKFPTGLGFGTVVCANYWFETLGVLAMVFMTMFDIGTIVYLGIATYFMHIWAAGKYARYKREFDPKVFPGKRWKWFPPFS